MSYDPRFTPVKAFILAFGIALAATPVLAETIKSGEAKTHIGQTLTVEGDVDNVHITASGMTFIDIGGRYPDNTFTAVIFADDADKFRDVDSFGGKTVDVTGPVRLYKGRPEIILKSADQIKVK